MAKKFFELGLAKEYVSDWTVNNAIREFMQNAIDQANAHENNDYSVSYDEENQELRIANKSSVLEKSSLLLGSTTKDENDIGGFGEGYKLACLVLLRNGINVRFENYGAREIWTFRFAKLKKYDHVESLACTVETEAFFKKVPNNDLTIVLSGITKEQYNDYLSLLIDPECEVIETHYGKILLDDEYIGKIYVNGLYVSDANEFQYGYDFKPAFIKIGRDRNLVNGWDISEITRDMWLEADRRDIVMRLLNMNAPDTNHIRFSWGTSSTTSHFETRNNIADDLYEEMEEKYGEGVIVTTSEDERHKLSYKYKNRNIVVANESVGQIINEASDRYKQVVKDAEEEFENAELTTVDKIYAWGLKHRVSTTDLEELFDIIGDKIDAPAVAYTSEKRGDMIYELQLAEIRVRVVDKLWSYDYDEHFSQDDDDIKESEIESAANVIMENIENSNTNDDIKFKTNEVMDWIDSYCDEYFEN